MKNKRAWLRILEATIAIMIIAGVLIVVYSRQGEKEDLSDYIYTLQKEILKGISLDSELRNATFSDNEQALTDFAETKVPASLEFEIRICNLTLNNEAAPCKLSSSTAARMLQEKKDVFSEEIVFAGDYQIYAPRKVKLFIWEAG